MSGTLNLSSNPLSRITVGNLDDMGYVVDYSNADPFTAADLDPSCVCRRRNLRDEARTKTEQEPLSDELRQYAIRKGQEILRRTRLMGIRSRTFGRDGDAIYVGDLGVSVLVLQGRTVHGVFVTREY